jgi:predicted AAA+ superfamily ATPase
MLNFATEGVKMLKRHIQNELESFLKIMPVVLIAGARQTGKTTLVESLSQNSHYTYVTFDDEFTLTNARNDPAGWLASLPKPLLIDEVQRAPEIFLPIKRDVDQHRNPGRYLITGSANPLLLPRLGDSLAGRMGIVNLYPFSQGELKNIQETFISKIFADELPFQKFKPLEITELHLMILRGGFPVAHFLNDLQDINRWVRSYLQTMMERDVRDISNIEGLRELPRLFRLLATRCGNLLNASEISRSLGMVNMTLNRYMRLLEILYFIYLLPAWYSNLGKRVTKSPKFYICDTAIMAQLMEVNQDRLQNDPSLAGQFLENFIFTELLKQRSWSSIPFELYHFRDGDAEVDFVLEQPDGSVVGIEVKSANKVRTDDLKGLKHLKKLSESKFKRGIVLHSGSQIELLEKDIYAIPLQALWSR